MNHLGTCPECHRPARQKNPPNGHVACGNKNCPVSRISIPVQAWQNWPRKGEARRVDESVEQAQQREQEIARLQSRLEKFGAVEQRNKELIQEAEDAKQRERRAKRSLTDVENKVYQLEQARERTTVEWDKQQLQIKGLTEWAIAGAKVSWAAENEGHALFFEEALDHLGKCNATEVPCDTCKKLPGQHQYHDRPMRLSCSCSVKQYTLQEWTKRQRQVRAAKIEAKRQARLEQWALDQVTKQQGQDITDINAFLREIRGNKSFSTTERLTAHQVGLLLKQTALLEKILEK